MQTFAGIVPVCHPCKETAPPPPPPPPPPCSDGVFAAKEGDSELVAEFDKSIFRPRGCEAEIEQRVVAPGVCQVSAGWTSGPCMFVFQPDDDRWEEISFSGSLPRSWLRRS
eukprot:TRINITY_DN32675_c0_g3_i2.p3 TRINITY_DN32675_c0_g3~~TRINITY_DN32675_c0_g3_i2.p3  ORF type:complete len:111 (-),score=36.14 TRINITY_DN32675_c0_g3_i2:204-536(-)